MTLYQALPFISYNFKPSFFKYRNKQPPYTTLHYYEPKHSSHDATFMLETTINTKSAANVHHKGTGKAITLQAWTGSQASRRLMFAEFLDYRHMGVVRLSALRLYPRRYFWYSFQLEADSNERINPIEKSQD
jgi:hypothetical protein